MGWIKNRNRSDLGFSQIFSYLKYSAVSSYKEKNYRTLTVLAVHKTLRYIRSRIKHYNMITKKKKSLVGE